MAHLLKARRRQKIGSKRQGQIHAQEERAPVGSQHAQEIGQNQVEQSCLITKCVSSHERSPGDEEGKREQGEWGKRRGRSRTVQSSLIPFHSPLSPILRAHC